MKHMKLILAYFLTITLVLITFSTTATAVCTPCDEGPITYNVRIQMEAGLTATYQVNSEQPVTISSNTNVTVNRDDSIRIEFTPMYGYIYDGYKKNNGSMQSGVYWDGKVRSNRTIKGFSTKKRMTTVNVILDDGLTGTYQVGNGGPSGSFTTDYEIKLVKNDPLTINFANDSGYMFLGWHDTVKGDGTGTYYDNSTGADRTIRAYSARISQVTVQVPTGTSAAIIYTDPFGIGMSDTIDGFAGGASGSYTVLYNSLFSATFTADTANAYVFDYWDCPIEGTGAMGDTYYVDEHVKNPRTVVGYAHQVMYDVQAVSDPSGVSAVFTGEGPHVDGTVYTVTLTDYDMINYVFTGWADGETEMVNTGNVNGGPVNLIAEFTDKLYKVSATANIGGTNAVFSGTGTDFLNGAPFDVQLVAFDDTAYTFEGWSMSNTGFIEGMNVELIANFAEIPPIPDTYTVRVTSNLPAGGVFSGYGTGFTDGSPYSVALISYDEVNYTFLGFQGVTSGNIAGADVDIVALFEENIIDEEIPEANPQPQPGPEDEPAPEPEPEPVPEPGPEDEPAPEPEPEEEFLDEETPEDLGDSLPETSGVAAGLFFGLGALLSGLGLIIRRRR